jgi:hypothetical protein
MLRGDEPPGDADPMQYFRSTYEPLLRPWDADA